MALLFLVLVLPTILIQVYLTPPIQVPDEENHFLRVVQVAGGRPFGRRLDGGGAGGILDGAAPVFAHAFDAIHAQPDGKLDPNAYAAAAALRWGQPHASTSFPNTAIYPAALYLPASLGLKLGLSLDLSVLDSFYLARLAAAMVSTALVALALAACGRGRALLFVVLCCPMTLSLFASVSPDGIALALGSLAVALWSRHASRGNAMPPPIRAVVSLALGMIAAARLPLAPLCILTILQPDTDRRATLRSTDWLAAAAGLVPLAIGIYGAAAAKVPFRESDGVSPSGQLAWLGEHPAEAAAVAVHTLAHAAATLPREFIGVLGWLDTELPESFYGWMAFCALAAIFLDGLSPARAVSGPSRWAPAAAAVTAVAGVFGTFYLAWTPVGALEVEGVQGRYFLVPAMVLAVSLPAVGSLGPMPVRFLTAARLSLCAAVALADLGVVPIALLHRFYG